MLGLKFDNCVLRGLWRMERHGRRIIQKPGYSNRSVYISDTLSPARYVKRIRSTGLCLMHWPARRTSLRAMDPRTGGRILTLHKQIYEIPTPEQNRRMRKECARFHTPFRIDSCVWEHCVYHQPKQLSVLDLIPTPSTENSTT